MIHFVGAGPGAVDLITVRGSRLISEADILIYAGSLVNPELLEWAKADCEIYNSAYMTLEEVLQVFREGTKRKKEIVRLHTGEPSLYGAIREQMDALSKEGISYDCCPGVSACFGAAASLDLEYTLPGITQSLIITRMEGKTAVPEREQIEKLAQHGCAMAIYLSTGMLEELSKKLISGGYAKDTPAAIVYKATWKDEKKVLCTIDTLAASAQKENITKTAVILVGDSIAQSGYEKSRLYAPDFSTEFRKGKEE